MARPQPPEMKVGNLITLPLYGCAHLVGHPLVRSHVEEDGSRVPDQTIGPTGDHAGPYDARERVHPEPAKGAGEQQADDDENRNSSIRNDMNDGGAHVIVPVRRFIRMLVLLESDRVVFTPKPDLRRKGMRFRDFLNRLQKAVARGEGEKLARAVRADRLD